MDARDVIKVGMSAERTLTVTPDRTVRHVVPTMPAVFGTPMMIMEMEMASADAINPYLQPGWVTVGTEVDIRHLAASAVGAVIRTTARVIAVARRSGSRSKPSTANAGSARAVMRAAWAISRPSTRASGRVSYFPSSFARRGPA